MERIHLPVRLLAELTTRSGDIDSRRSDPDSMAEGARAHRLLQKRFAQRYDSVKSELPLELTLEYGGYELELQGRADCLIDGGTVCEIKTTLYDISALDPEDRSFWAQAECYAYIYALQNGLESMRVRLTLYCIDADETAEYDREYTLEELRGRLYALLDAYLVWLKWSADWAGVRDRSIAASGFPFESYRKGQRELAVACYKAITGGKRIYVQAPTGIGKTVSTLFPAVKALGNGGCDKIFYLTAKAVARRAAEDALENMRGAGFRLKSITLTAKNTICFREKPACTPESCEYAKGHFDRVDGAVRDILDNEDACTRETIESYAKKHRVCPFELGLDVSLYADVVICDYNYLFDPRVALKRFFASDSGGRWAFLIDEAHNLPDRARDMYSAELDKKAFADVKKLIRERAGAKPLTKQLNAVSRQFTALEKRMQADTDDGGDVEQEGIVFGENFMRSDSDEMFGGLYEALDGFLRGCDKFFRKNHAAAPLPGDDELLALYFECLFFLKIRDLYCEDYTAIFENRPLVRATLFCADPRRFVAAGLDKGVGAALFSATLTPLGYFKEILGGREEDGAASIPSPFDRRRFLLMADARVSTKYKDRERTRGEVAELIYAGISGKTGNYMAFFPSYAYMEEVFAQFCERHPEVNTARQSAGMTPEEREEFLARFSAENPDGLLGFCVLGGAFGEGIDLRGDRLIGVIIVGVGLPQLNLRQDVIREHCEPEGFEYAYMSPGMNKVLQAAGRVIRTEADIGTALLIDSRFARPDYRALFPAHWSGMRYVSSADEVRGLIRDFWAGGQCPLI